MSLFSADAPSMNTDLNRYTALAEGQVVPEAARCVQCGICSYNCPINIDVRAHAWRGLPVQDSHCLTCGECVQRCPRGVLRFERIELFDAGTTP
jgi:heterodisulfide reductase subunit C